MEEAKITNINKNLFINGRPPDRCHSQVLIESTLPLKYHYIKENENILLIELEGANLNMPDEEVIEVYDGLLETIEVSNNKESKVVVKLKVLFPTLIHFGINNAPPYQLQINLSRYYLEKLFFGKRVVIDPGHGGIDPGVKGPVGLAEKDAVTNLSHQLRKILEMASAKVFLTRQGNEKNLLNTSKIKWTKIQNANILVSLHTRHQANKESQGFSIEIPSHNKKLSYLGEVTAKYLSKKLYSPNNAVTYNKSLSRLNLPAYKVKPATITNTVEEGLLMNTYYQWKIAEAIFSALALYFNSSSES